MSDPHEVALSRQVLRKVTWRLVPFLCLLYFLNILDRANVGFARLTMKDYLEMDTAVFDWGIGFFYVGYLAFEVPSNLLLRRFGARRWMGRIMISWGLVSMATSLVTGPASFYAVRILLGVAEAGFFPGIILYMTYWFPARERARIIALFMAAIPISGMIGNTISGAIMQYMDGVNGLADWKWLFLLEGVPSVLFGIVTLFYLTDHPAEARWLTEEERNHLVTEMNKEEQLRRDRHGADFWPVIRSWRIWLLIAIYFTISVSANGSGAYLAEVVDRRFKGADKFQVGLLSALPHLCALIGMTVLGMHSDRTGERRRHAALAIFLAAVGWAIGAYVESRWLALAGLCLAQMGTISFLPVFWALPTAFLSGVAAAGGIAFINSVANIGGIVAPRYVGRFGLEGMAALVAVGFVLTLCIPRNAGLRKETTS